MVYKLNEYNRHIAENQITDQYEAMYYERLHSALRDLSFMDTKADQITRLEETFKWAKEQETLVMQRRDQGEVRYEVTKEVRYGVEPEKKEIVESEKSFIDELPS